MGNSVSKNGAITKLVEAIPGGGFFTAPVHAAAGNSVHAVQAGTAGFGTLAGAAMGPVGAMVAGAGTSGLKGIFDQLGLSDDKKDASVVSCGEGNYEKAAKILVEAVNEKLVANSRQLASESNGQWRLKSCHGTYLRAYKSKWEVDMAPTAAAWENWYIEDWHGTVVVKAIHSPGRFLSAHSDGRVDLVDQPKGWEKWKPFQNDDGSWSFLSAHGRWLSADKDASVTSVKDCNAWEHFWLERSSGNVSFTWAWLSSDTCRECMIAKHLRAMCLPHCDISFAKARCICRYRSPVVFIPGPPRLDMPDHPRLQKQDETKFPLNYYFLTNFY